MAIWGSKMALPFPRQKTEVLFGHITLKGTSVLYSKIDFYWQQVTCIHLSENQTHQINQ